MKYNGCGVIAAYNVMRKLGKTKKLTDIIYDFDVRSGSLAIGMFGADPTHFGTYFSGNGLKYSKYYNFDSLQPALSKMKENQVALVCAWNSSSFSEGVHYVAVEKLRNGYLRIYNAYNNRSSYEDVSKIDKYFKTGELIIAYIVG